MRVLAHWERMLRLSVHIMECVMYQQSFNREMPYVPQLTSGGRQEQGRKGGFWRRIFRQWQRRKMIATLQAMDDHLLFDIGVSRGDIPRIVDSFTDRELGMRVPFRADSRGSLLP